VLMGREKGRGLEWKGRGSRDRRAEGEAVLALQHALEFTAGCAVPEHGSLPSITCLLKMSLT
jgi:hypothetical protein